MATFDPRQYQKLSEDDLAKMFSLEQSGEPVVFTNETEEAQYERWRNTQDPEGTVRGDILPIKKDEQGKRSFAMPQFLRDLTNSARLMDDVANKGYVPTNEDIAQFGLDFGVLGGVASRVLEKPDENTVGMFLGRLSKGADKRALDEAEMLEEKGFNEDEIWLRTGWWRKPDGHWVWEISDDEARINPKLMETIFNDFPQSKAYESNITGILQHKELAEASKQGGESYGTPRLTTVVSDQSPQDLNWSGLYEPKSLVDNNPQITIARMSEDEMLNTLLHEVQHHISNIENWPDIGSNPSTSTRLLEGLKESMPQPLKPVINVLTKVGALTKAIEAGRLSAGDKRIYEKEIGSLTNLLELMAIKNPDLKPMMEDFSEELSFISSRDGYQFYKENEGETLARLTETRRNLTPAQRAVRTPSKDLDVDINNVWWRDAVRSAHMNIKKKKEKHGIIENDPYEHMK